MKLIKLATCALGVLGVVSLGSCSTSENVIYIGTMSTPGEPVIENIKEDFEALGYTLEIVELTSFETGNVGLANGSIDCNLFQHDPYLQTFNEANGTDLMAATTVYTCTYGGYSTKISSIDDLKTIYIDTGVSPIITIANDSSNGLRCLNILQNEGLITFDEDKYYENITDISLDTCLTSNPYNLTITATSTATIAASLDTDDVYMGIVNATYALAAGLTSDLLICEEPEETNIENANILAIRSEDKDEQWVKDLVSCITSDKSASFIDEYFNGVVQHYFDVFIDLD